MVYDGDVYVHLSGNQVGVLLLDYICQCIKSQEGADKLCGKYVYKSIVSTPLIDKIAAAYGINVESTLTGFKNIAVKIEALCRKAGSKTFYSALRKPGIFIRNLYQR